MRGSDRLNSMNMTHRLPTRPAPVDDARFADQATQLRRDYLNFLLLGALGPLTLFILRAAAWHDTPGLFYTWQVPAAMSVGLLATSAMRARHARLASWIFILTLVLVNALEVAFFPHSPALYFFAVIGVAASLLRSERGTGFTLALILAAMGVTAVVVRTTFGVLEFAAPFLVTLLSSAVAWLGTHRLYTVLQWEWHSTTQALAAARAAQEHRAELMRLNKELDGAYMRLERMNRMLILAKAEAEEAKAFKVQFANAVSHELRSPINLVIGFSDMMVNAPQVYPAQTWTPQLKAHLAQIYHSSQHLSQLIDDVLDLARIDAYRLSLVKTRGQVAQAIAEAYEIVHSLYEARKLYLHVDLDSDLPEVLFDHTRIRQVLLNLLTNAVRFTSDGGVTIRAWAHTTGSARGVDAESDPGSAQPCIVISVTDTGVGIAREDLPKLFQVFVQLESTYRWNHGSGLGLSISKQLVELHGGRIWAESALDQGTSFLFTLPLAAAAEGDAMRSAAGAANDNANDAQFWDGLEQQARQRKSILAMCDEAQGRRIIADGLRNCDVTWISEHVASSDLAAAIRETHPSALVHITGQCQPEVIGHALTKTMPGLPVISCALSGLASAPRNPNLSDYLVKPISRRKLAEACARLERSGLHIKRAVVIEDEAPMREFLVLALGTILGGTAVVHSAGTADEGLRLIHSHRPDLVTLDLNLPDTDGLALAQQLHEQFEGRLNVIAVTARDADVSLCGDADDIVSCSRATRFSQRELSAMLDAMLSHLSPPLASPSDSA